MQEAVMQRLHGYVGLLVLLDDVLGVAEIRAAALTLILLIGGRCVAAEFSFRDVGRAALWADAGAVAGRHVGMREHPRKETEVELLKKDDILSGVFLHVPPRVRVAVHAIEPEGRGAGAQ